MNGIIVCYGGVAIKISEPRTSFCHLPYLYSMIKSYVAVKRRFDWLPAAIVALIFVAMTAAASVAAPSPELTYLREHYTKYEYHISMRDGVHLFTAVYAPK